MLAGLQAMNSLRSAVLQRLLRLLKKRWKQLGQDRIKASWRWWPKSSSQKSSPARVRSLKPWVLSWERGTSTSNCLCSVPPSVPLVHHTVQLDGGRPFQGIKPISSLSLCWRATLHSRTILLPPWSLCRDRELLANVCYELKVARLGAAAMTAGFLPPLRPS